MMRQTLPAALALLTLTAGVAPAQVRISYDHYTLPNGLSVFLVQDRSTPIVTVDVWYNVGSRNERVGRSGFAHLFEHMMFQGSAHVDKGAHMQLLERAGGTLNGTTNEDRTNYYETVPSNRLNLALWLEADRMRSLAITQENFENQRETVKEERRLRVDNQPYGKAFTEGLTLLFDSTSCFPYAHTVIGSMDDLNAAQVQDVQAFFDQYYAPNNATLTVVGDFETSEAKNLIERYFGDIPGGDTPAPLPCNADYTAGKGRRVWEDRLANLPAVVTTYLVPEHKHADTPALSLLATILGQGESSRLNQSLVRERQVALGAGAQELSRRGPSQFLTFAIANQGVDADSIEAALHGEVARVVAEGVTDAELEKARNDFRAGNIMGAQTTMNLAERVQHFVHYHDSVDEIDTDLDRYLAVTRADIQRVARRYLVPENGFTIVVVPASRGQGAVQP